MRSVPGGGNGRGEDPEVGTCPVYRRNYGTRVAGVELGVDGRWEMRSGGKSG